MKKSPTKTKPKKKKVLPDRQVNKKSKRISKVTGKEVQSRTYTTKTGRPTKYKPEFCQAIIDYFTIKPTDKAEAPPYIQEFCLSIGISKECMHDWVAKYPDFSDAYKIAKAKQKQIVIDNALLGGYNASFAWRMMMNMFGWRDKLDSNVNLMDGGALQSLLSALPSEYAEKVKKALTSKK